MTNPFAAAIETLRGEWEHMREDLDVEYLTRSGDISSHEAAIRVLEAAGNFTADDLERITNTLDDFIEYTPISSYKCPGRVLKDKFIALLKAIPALPDAPDKGEPK